MSLLEDIFLEDEADEAQELERVIEGDDFDAERVGSDDDEVRGDDEAEEDKRRVDPSKPKTVRVVKNPRVTLNPARLTGPRGIQVIPDHFKDFKLKGKGHEKEDLDAVLKRLEHWAHRLYPKFQFQDCLKKIETLGKKRPVMVHLHKIRSGQLTTEENIVQKDSSDDEAPPAPQEMDEFDKLLQHQIELARATPGPDSAKKLYPATPLGNRTPALVPKATSSPSISEEQKQRMLKNRQMAEERRLARLKKLSETLSTSVPQDRTADTEVAETEEDPVVENNILTEDVINSVFEKQNTNNVIDLVTLDRQEELINNSDDSNASDVQLISNNPELSQGEDDSDDAVSFQAISKSKNVNSVNYSEELEYNNDSDSSDDNFVTAANHSIVVDVHKSTVPDDTDENQQTLKKTIVNNSAVDLIKVINDTSKEVDIEPTRKLGDEIMEVDNVESIDSNEKSNKKVNDSDDEEVMTLSYE